MPTTADSPELADARAAIKQTTSFEEVLTKLSARDRLNAEKHLAACEADEDKRHAPLWRRLVSTLMTLAPLPAKFTSQQTAQFYIPDGKYRLQAFALEDGRENSIGVYCSDVIDQATDAGLLTANRSDEPGLILAKLAEGEMLEIERLDGQATSMPEFYKHMLGWNRRAIRISLRSDASETQIRATELLCALSAKKLTGGKVA